MKRTLNDSLYRPIELTELDNSLWNDKCDYIELDHCGNLNPNNYNLIIMKLNVRSILVHQQELKQLLRSLEKKNSHIDTLLLCETFLSSKTEQKVNFPGYTHVGNHRPTIKGGGVSLLLNNNITYKRHKDLDIFEEGLTESVFIEAVAKNGKHLVIGSMYKPPNADHGIFSNHLKQIMDKVKVAKGKLQPEVIIGMDHNMNLLKGLTHNPTCKFIDNTSELDLLPTITHPSRITPHSVTLIDNIYVRESLHRSFDSALLINDMSDHLPLIVMLKLTKFINKEPLMFES